MSRGQQWEIELINCLVKDIPKRFGKISSTMKPQSKTNPALILIEAILSVHRHYDPFVPPRVDSFGKNHPNISSLRSLLALVYTYGGPAKFFKTQLDYDYPDMAKTFADVLQYFISIEGEYQGATEFGRLHNWAMVASPCDYENVCDNTGEKVYGFNITTFQDIRRLLGADTVKPDTHVIQYIQDACGRRISKAKAVHYLEEAAKRLGISAKELDCAIWNRYARGSSSKTCR